MNRCIATWATIAIATFGLTACSSAPSAPVAPVGEVSSAPVTSAPPAEQASPAAPETTDSGQTLADACIEPSAKLVEAEAELAKASIALSQSGAKNPKQLIKAMHAYADYFGKIAESTSHPDVKKALLGIQKGYHELADIYTKLLVKKDYTAAADASKVLAELQESMKAFQKLCGA